MIIDFSNESTGKLGKLWKKWQLTFIGGQYFGTFQNEIVDKQNGME